MSRVKLFLLLSSLIYTFFILYLSLINLADTPVSKLGVSDKLMHGAAYFGLGLLWILYAFWASAKPIKTLITYVAVASIIFGIFIEVLQDSLTVYRQLDFFDILANSFGVVLAGLSIWFSRKSLTRFKGKINLFFMKN